MVTFSHKSCKIKGCMNAAVAESPYCPKHKHLSARIPHLYRQFAWKLVDLVNPFLHWVGRIPGILKAKKGQPILCRRVRMGHYTIRISRFESFFDRMARSETVPRVPKVFARFQAYCAGCGGQFTIEALQHLIICGNRSSHRKLLGGPLRISGATSEGEALRAGRCPNCGHSKMRIVVGD